MIAIQWEDVIGVLQTCAPYLIALAVLWVIAVIVMIACRKAKKSRKFPATTTQKLGVHSLSLTTFSIRHSGV